MRVALYLRRSTLDLQHDSLEAQEELLRAFAARHHHEIVRVFRESQSGRHVEQRRVFLGMIDEVQSGECDFEGILVRDVSRWSRADSLDSAAFYEWVCKRAGVGVVFVDETFGPDGSPMYMLGKALKRYVAAEFSNGLSRQVVASHTRLVRDGFWPTGACPYGLKRQLVDERGEALRDLAKGDRKALSNQRVKLALGAASEVAVVRRIYAEFVSGKTMDAIAAGLNAESVRPPRGGPRWLTCTVSHMLQNELCSGRLKALRVMSSFFDLVRLGPAPTPSG